MNDDDLDAASEDTASELGFEPAVSATGTEGADGSAAVDGASPRRNRRALAVAGGLRRKLGATVVLLGALAAMGGGYAAFATSSGAAPTTSTADQAAAGKGIYENTCITCHGDHLQGVVGQGPSLLGVGSAAVYFQVSTGRMPLGAQGAYAPQGQVKFDEKQIEQLGAYVEAMGGGPSIPEGRLRSSSAALGQGGELFRLNCAQCHGATGAGAPLSAGKVAPSIRKATDKQIYAAMLTGPGNMPVFSDNSVTPAEKRSIISYIQALHASADPGGAGIDRIGPASEAIVIWVAGVGALMIAILWIGARER